jgi:uncharacterized protein
MPYLVDGHNLIPKIPGISLQDPDDELKLIRILLEYTRITQSSLEVYFDRAPAGYDKTRQLGRVKAVFVSDKTIADEMIIRRIKTLGRSAQNWTVVTSDHRIQADAKESRAIRLSSEEFAQKIMSALEKSGGTPATDRDMSADELDSWMKLFNQKK